MFLRNEMKFIIIFLFLAAAASFGLATDAPKKSHNATSTGKPDSSTSVPTNPSVQVFANAVNEAANNPITQLGKLSKQCQAALVNIVANPEFFECIPIQSLLPLIQVTDPKVLQGILKDPVHKLPPLLEPVFDGICAAPKCSDKGVSEALKAIEDGCKKDAKDPLIVIATGLITFYSPLRDSICFKTNKGGFCVFDTLKKVLSLPKPPVPITNTFFDNVAFAKPKEVCTPCNKAILNTVVNFIEADTNKCVEFLEKLNVPVGLLPFAKIGVALKCGFQFLDGKPGDPEKTDPDDFEYQLSIGHDVPVLSGASNLKGIGFMTMIGALLASILMI